MAQNIQNNNHNNTILIVIAILLLVIGTAAASVYFARSTPTPVTVASVSSGHVVHRQVVERRVATAPPCNDHNIVGEGLGGVGGGVLGSTIGKGHGNTAATIAGTLGGAYVGGEVIPTNGVTCR